MTVRLSPVQQEALDSALAQASATRPTVLTASPGCGRTTVPQMLARQLEATFLGAQSFLKATAGLHPLALEDALHNLLSNALLKSDAVVLDDLHLITDVVAGCHSYPRGGYVSLALSALADDAERLGKPLVLGTFSLLPVLWTRYARVTLGQLTADDYAHICTTYLGAERASQVDFKRIYRFAKRLNARQLRTTCEALAATDLIDAELFLSELRRRQLASNVDLWLNMRLPNEEARAAILADRCADLPAAIGPVDLPRLATATEGLSGADLRRLVDDGKLLFAYDVARGIPTRPAVDYFLDAVTTVRANKQHYAEAEARARATRPHRPPYFDLMESAMIAGMSSEMMVPSDIPGVLLASMGPGSTIMFPDDNA